MHAIVADPCNMKIYLQFAAVFNGKHVWHFDNSLLTCIVIAAEGSSCGVQGSQIGLASGGDAGNVAIGILFCGK